jgi:hypothetical protein
VEEHRVEKQAQSASKSKPYRGDKASPKRVEEQAEGKALASWRAGTIAMVVYFCKRGEARRISEG